MQLINIFLNHIKQNKDHVIFYPILFAIFPILFLYAYNINETTVDQIWVPLGICIAGTIGLWVLMSFILNSILKAGLATAIFLFLFFSYGRFYALLESWNIFVPKHAHLIPPVLLVFGYCVYFIKVTVRDFVTTTKILNVVSIVIIALNLFSILFYEIGRAPTASIQSGSLKQADGDTADVEKLSALPDIYYIILDEYAHPDTMRDWYEYDNSQFIKELTDKGFFVAQKSRTRTPASPLAIAQVLNMEYYTAGWEFNEANDCFAEIVPGQPTVSCNAWDKARFQEIAWDESTFRKIAFNEVVNFLRPQGYKWVYFGNFEAWEPLMKDNADLYFNYYLSESNKLMTEFQNILWKTTMIKPFYTGIIGTKYMDYYRRGVVGTLEQLKQMPELEYPTFVFAHLMCPHEPFVFGSKSEYIHPDNYSNYEDKQFYLGQYIFISTEIQRMVDTLLQKSKIPPIIILQSDHGLKPGSGLRNIAVDGNEWRKILNAIYLPGMDKALLYDSISPVNTFRFVFNHYFGADYPLLEDD